VRRAALLLLAAVLLAGCGGSKKSADPGRDAIDALVQAARQGDEGKLWSLVSDGTRARLKTKQAVAALVERKLKPFYKDDYRTVVSRLITNEYGVTAIANGRAIVAIPLRKTGSKLRAELGTRLRVDPTGPLPKVYSEPPPAQVAVEGKGGFGELTAAIIWLDGGTRPDEHLAGDAAGATVFVNYPQQFRPGRHSVVALLATLNEAAATAWRFTVKGKP
jgi:hypothetical protein